MKRITMLAMTAALAALMVPATAAAQWQDNHQTLAQNAVIQYTGQYRYQGEAGIVECQMTAAVQLTAGTTTAHVQSFAVDLEGGGTVTDHCSIGGGYGTLGCTDVSAVTGAGFPWTAHATSTQTIAITTGTIQTHMHGGFFCPKTMQFTPGTLHLTMSTQNTWSTGELGGLFQVHPSIGSSQTMTITGHGAITPSATYGVS
jgi:hypothetical protein